MNLNVRRLSWLVAVLLLAGPTALAETKPLRALLIAGGCCHDYATQHKTLSAGLQARANIQVDVVWTDDKGKTPPFPIFDKEDWAAGYDVIIHDECAGGVTDVALIERIAAAHATVPAVHLHCSMHSFRNAPTEAYVKHLGLRSMAHGPQKPIAISIVDKAHPIVAPLADWTTVDEELYNNVAVHDARPLAIGKQTVEKHGVAVEEVAIVAWINESVGARTFCTTIGHNNETVADPRYLDLVARGTLWACDKLNDEYLTPFQGKNTVTFVPAPPAEKTEAAKPEPRKRAKPASEKATPEKPAAPTAEGPAGSGQAKPDTKAAEPKTAERKSASASPAGATPVRPTASPSEG